MILVTGSTGFIGRNLITRLVDSGRRVRCLLPERRQRNFPWDIDAKGAPEIVTGTLLDEEALFHAVNGVHTIIHLENAMWWGRARDLERVEIVGTRNLIAAARSGRVGRIITVSHLGCSPSSAYTLLRVKGQVEDLIHGSGLAYTIIRSGIVFGSEDAFINHVAMMLRLNPIFFLMPGIGEVVLHPLYIDDLVEAICRCLDLLNVVDTTIEVGGPEYITLEDFLHTIMRVAGMRRLLVSTPPYLLRWITALYGLIFGRTLMTQQWLDLLAASRTARLGNMYTYFGIEPRRFEDTLLTYLPSKPFLLPAFRYAFRRRPREF